MSTQWVYKNPWTKLLSDILDQQDNFPFILLHGPSQLGKSKCALAAIQKRIWRYTQDLFHIRNCTELLGKKHSIKIDNSDYIDLSDGTRYRDAGSRQLVSRLTKSPAGSTKYVLIEDIERMSRGAVNALLKAMEEPLPGRKIIATTSNKESLIATILSRATLIPFVLVPDSDMRTIITSQWYEVTNQLLHIAGWRPELALKLLQDPALLTTLQEFSENLQTYRTTRKFVKLYKQLQAIEKQNLTAMAMDGFVSRLEESQDFESADQVVDVLSKRQSNVSMDTLLFCIAKLRA